MRDGEGKEALHQAAERLVISYWRWRLALFACAAIPFRVGAQATDTLRGKVTTDSGVVIVGAEVVATRAPDRAFKSGLTDSAGNYQIIFEQGTGDYLLHVSALGRETLRLRVRRKGVETTLTSDFQLKSSVQKLETVTVDAVVDKPERDQSQPTTQPGDAARNTDGVTASVPPDLAGNIAATAATVPGVALTPFGISVLGLDPSQNRTTVNGMSFSGADIPRNVRTVTRVTTSSYDPALGWFSGAEVDETIGEGAIYTSRPISLTFDAPALQYTDRTSRALGQKYGNALIGLGQSGGLLDDRLRYATGIDLSHRSSGFASLDHADADLLGQSGIARDSAARLLNILAGAGIPIAATSGLGDRTSDNLTFLGRLDRAPYSYSKNREEKMTWGLLGYAKLAHSSLIGVDPRAVVTHGGDSRQQILMGQAQYSSFFHHGDFLTDAHTSVSVKHDKSAPYLRLPDGTVLVSSQLDDGLAATTSLGFGGNAALLQNSREWTWETKDFTRFYASKKTHHRIQLTVDSRFDGLSQSGVGNTFGTFTFNSLADVAANAPSSFTRTLNAPFSSSKAWNAFGALGDYWRKSPTFQLLAGARVEASRFLDRPAFNPQIEQTFGARNDVMPRSIHISPRLGFTWVRQIGGEGTAYGPMGTFNTGSIGYVRGGIGEFRGFLAPSIASQALVATGLPGGAAYLTCIGDATPPPDWASYALDQSTIPDRCANTTGPPAFVDVAPAITLFDKTYQPPRSWRANLSYASNAGPLLYTIEGIYSLNLNQPGWVDLNFANSPRFTLSSEGRPVFADVTSIVPATGLVSGVDARRSLLFGPVISNRSDLRSISRQLTVNLAPDLPFARGWYASLAYTVSSTRALASGFDEPTFGSPLLREWARGSLDARHSIQLQLGKTIKRVTFTLFGAVHSGLPFTPLVGGDVNGDGLINDRAFVFDPAASTDSATAATVAGLNELEASSSSRVRDCLVRQIGRVAERNGCEGPWTASLSANLVTGFEFPRHSDHSVTVSLAFANPLGGLDQLLHGSSHLRGWGLPALPDPVLYTVRGFDAASKTFRYDVNPRFGNTEPASSIIRSPFRVTLDVSINIAPSMPLQQLKRLVSAGRGGHPGQRLGVDNLKKRLARNVPDPYAQMLEESDSLLLTEQQEQALESAQADYLRGIDSVWTPLGEYLAGLGDTFDIDAAMQRQEDATDAAWEYSRQHIQETLDKILAPIQIKLLPWLPAYLYHAKERVKIRIYMD